MPYRNRIALMILAAATALAAGAGCSKELTIVQYPPFWTSDLQTIAVVPFRNATGVQGAGDAVADELARAMAANQTYKVYSRNDLKALLDQEDLKMALGGDASQASAALAKVGSVQAILTGTVSTYAATTRSEQRAEPVYDKKGRVIRYDYWTYTRNEANVVVSAAMIRTGAGSGGTLHATGAPVQCAVPAESTRWSQPEMDPYGCLAAARQQAIARLMAEFCVTRQKIKVKPKDTLFTTAEGKFEGKYEKEDAFTTADTKMLGVLVLPACCDRNRFRVAVAREKARENIKDFQVVWDRGRREMEIPLNPREIASAGGGPGKYELKLYSGEAPAIVHKFRIKEP